MKGQSMTNPSQAIADAPAFQDLLVFTGFDEVVERRGKVDEVLVRNYEVGHE